MDLLKSEKDIYPIVLKLRSLGRLLRHYNNESEDVEYPFDGCGMLLQELADSLMSVLEGQEP